MCDKTGNLSLVPPVIRWRFPSYFFEYSVKGGLGIEPAFISNLNNLEMTKGWIVDLSFHFFNPKLINVVMECLMKHIVKNVGKKVWLNVQSLSQHSQGQCFMQKQLFFLH